MALSQSALSELLDAFRSGDGVGLVRESVRMMVQELIEAGAAERIRAGRYERTETRTTERNGHPAGVVGTSPTGSRSEPPSPSNTATDQRPP